MIRRPPRSTLFPYRRSSDLSEHLDSATSTIFESRLLGLVDRGERKIVIDCGSHDRPDRKSTRLNSSHQIISYAVFCLKKKTKNPLPFNRSASHPSSVQSCHQ